MYVSYTGNSIFKIMIKKNKIKFHKHSKIKQKIMKIFENYITKKNQKNQKFMIFITHILFKSMFLCTHSMIIIYIL